MHGYQQFDINLSLDSIQATKELAQLLSDLFMNYEKTIQDAYNKTEEDDNDNTSSFRP